MSKEVFTPVRGTEASILSKVPQAGYVYFALDTKKIYYSDGESFLPMGGNTGVWYGKMEYAETPEESQVEFDFSPDQIEGNEDAEDGKYSLPNVDDLIFNTPDGCFYRVMEVDKSSSTPVLHCYKLTVAGTGGGGGSGTGGVGSMIVSRIGDQTINTLQGNACYINYRFIAKDAAGEDTGSGTASLYVKGTLRATFTAQQGDNSINVGPYLEIGENAIRLVVSGSIGGTSNITQTKNWTVISTNLALTWNYDDTRINTAENFEFNWTVSISLDHTTYIVIDDLYTIEVPSTTVSREKTYIVNRQEYGLTHGSHEVKMYAATTINDTTFTSAPITHYVICADENRSDTIISVALNNFEVDQYDTLSIPIVFYNPSSATGKVSAILREDGVDKDNWIDYDSGVQYYWNYTPITSGTKILTILSGTTEETFNVQVNDLGLSVTEVPGYDFKFKASDITSNNALQNWSYGSIVPSFSQNFDWINGGLKAEKDENGNDRNYINIKAGSQMSFNYAPLAGIGSRDGFDIKIIFKAVNCRSYDAQVLSVGSINTDNVYLNITANEGIYKSVGSTLRVPYCEDTYIEFEVDAWPNNEHPYLMTWLDGVPTSVVTYDATTDKFDNATANLVIGSEDCDVQIYLIKIYKKHLSNEQHLTNFILDAPNATEIVNRYNRNNILDDNGEISYNKLIEKNPNCSVYLYEIDRMTKTKKDPVNGCTYARYKGSTTPLQTAENVTIKVQGTSSAKYVIAAANLDSDFKDGFIDYSKNPNGEHIDGWSMSEHAFPVSYLTTKVNVASCEGANNAINQEWYNRYVPYVTEYHNKYLNGEIEYQPRNTIEFENMGVLFIKDNNPETTGSSSEDGAKDNVFKDTPGYINNPYFKMYSICNMGNSKKNEEVFTDPENPYEVIMEVADNQLVQQQMTDVSIFADPNDNTKLNSTYTNVEEWKIGDTGVFEWRNAPSSSMLAEANQAWYDLIKWFADNNPNAATNEDLAESVHFDAYTFKGYTSAKTGYSPATQVLKGTTIETYAGDYNKDTYEYRMAKMLNECEDHLIMDAIVFHFLFIERHTLIDNVAKNTFWHTEDFQHWSMIKDYDNDTSDGNDNSGNLTLTYGYEVLDRVGHSTNPNVSFVFNAASSVWLHFIEGLLPARETVYRYLDSQGAWTASTYLAEFDKWQSSLPERIWIEDYYRKYLRPYEIYGDDSYLARLEGGKKTHQRRQYETYQEKYVSSEYQGILAASSAIDIRANGTDIASMYFPMTMYADSYIRIAAGSGQNPNVRIRAKRGETYNVQLPVTGDANDMTTYFFLPGYITSLKNVEQLQPKNVNLNAASRLREFSMKTLENPAIFYEQVTSSEVLDPDTNYYEYINNEYTLVEEPVEANKTNYYKQIVSNQNINLEEIKFESNPMLEKLEVVDCPNISNALNLTNSANLKYLDIRNSGFTGIAIASNSPLETLYLNSPTSLYLSNLSRVSNFSIQGYNKMATLTIDNIDDSPGINSKTLAENSSLYKTSAKLSYNLQNVKWIIDDSDEISDDPLTITILDRLVNEDPMDPVSRTTTDQALALTGNLNITSEAYNGTNSFELYDKYTVNEYPNLNINFEGNNAKLFNITILDGNNNIVWGKKAKANYTLNAAFFEDSPYGNLDRLINDIIVKASTASQTFTFNDEWLINDSLTISSTDNKPIYTDTTFNEDIVIKPIFTSAIRQYTVTIMNDNEEYYSDDYDYGTKIKDIVANITPPSKDDSNLGIYETYAFRGYALIPTASAPLNLTDDYIVNTDVTYYAIYTDAIDVNDSANVNYDNFIFTTASFTDRANQNFNIASGYNVKPKRQLTGKITIPAYYNNLPIVSISGFGDTSQSGTNIQQNVTGIFFEQGSQIRVFGSYAFAYMPNLLYVEIPDSLREISSAVFNFDHIKWLRKGQAKTDTNYYFGGANLYYIDTQGFANCVNEDCNTLTIGSSITKALTGSIINFNYASNITAIYFGTGDEGIQMDTSIEHPFRLNGGFNTRLTSLVLYLPSSVYTSADITTFINWIDPYYHVTSEAEIPVGFNISVYSAMS